MGIRYPKMTNFHFTKSRFAQSCSISLIIVIKKNHIIFQINQRYAPQRLFVAPGVCACAADSREEAVPTVKVPEAATSMLAHVRCVLNWMSRVEEVWCCVFLRAGEIEECYEFSRIKILENSASRTGV